MPADHPLRRQLHDELHARPSLYFEAPAIVWHEAFYLEGAMVAVPEPLRTMHANVTRDGRSGVAQLAHGGIKWEVHTEFVSLTHYAPWSGDPSNVPPPDDVWNQLLEAMTGQRIASVEVLVSKAGASSLSELLGPGGDAVASLVGGGDAEVWSTFQLGKNDASRIIILNRNLNSYRTGRMVRRLLEIEDYRMMALLSQPYSQEAFVRCAAFEARLSEIMEALASGTRKQDALLFDLTKLSADILDFSTNTRDRFSATAAYSELVFKRLEELREERIEGRQRIGVFVDRRFRPSVRACAQADQRIENSAVRVARASELLRTSVQVELEQQNALLLASMERRVALQTKLQEAVEGLSIIAISYYALATSKLILEGLADVYYPIHWLKSYLFLFAPLVFAIAWLAVHRVRGSLKRLSPITRPITQ